MARKDMKAVESILFPDGYSIPNLIAELEEKSRGLHDTVLMWEQDDWDGAGCWYVTGWREMTPPEKAAAAKARKRAAATKAKRAARAELAERKEYERLKAKFG